MAMDITPTSASVISPLKSSHDGIISAKTAKLSLQTVLEQWRGKFNFLRIVSTFSFKIST